MSGTGDASTPSFGAVLRRSRQEAGLSQEELAARAGMSSQAIGSLERGERQHPYPVTVRRLADALGLTDDERTIFLANARAHGASNEPPAEHAAVAASSGPPPVVSAGAPTSPDHSDRPEVPDLPELPTPLTPLLGRDGDVARAITLLREGVRLLTLTGPGGIGKTRLSLHIAREARAQFADGVAFVPLAPLAEAGLVLPTIAWVLGLLESDGQPLGELLQRALRGRRRLLVLDNCEHVLAGAVEVAALLEGCPRLAVLATSRAALRVRGEHEYPLAPLALPAFDRQVSLEEATGSPAVRLFVERAQAANPAFALTTANAAAVAAICGRLDGLPLALELAAPRVKLLSPTALLGRLHHTLPLLTGGDRDAPGRQQTLRAALDWSYRLLSAQEQRLFARLSVFAGCGLEAMEAVCNAEGELDVLESAAALVEQSLLLSEAGPEDEPRFAMLQTIREYAGAQLEACGEAEAVRRRHAAYYLSRAEEAAPELTGPEQAVWLERLERDLANLRAALGWAREHDQIASGLRLAGALVHFWRVRGYGSEGLGWLAGFIARMGAMPAADGDAVPTAVRARAVYGAGMLANGLGDQRQAVPWLERAAALYHAAGEPIGAIHALSALAGVAYDQGDLRDALTRYQECVALARATQDDGELARALGNAGEMYYHLDDLPRATEYYEESLAVARQSGRVEVEAAQLGNLGNVACRRGDLRRAATLHRQALELKWALGYRRQVAITLEDLAALAAAEGRTERAAHLLGAATELRGTIGSPQPVPERRATEQVVAGARTALGADAWASALAVGRALALSDAVAYALDQSVSVASVPGALKMQP